MIVNKKFLLLMLLSSAIPLCGMTYEEMIARVVNTIDECTLEECYRESQGISKNRLLYHLVDWADARGIKACIMVGKHDPNARNESGNTVMHHLWQRYGDEKISMAKFKGLHQTLLNLGAKEDIKNNGGLTPQQMWDVAQQNVEARRRRHISKE